MGNIVRHSNEINNLKTGGLTEVELDLFITALYLLKDKKSDEITLTFAEIRKVAEIKGNHSDRLIKNIKSMSKKLINMNQEVTLPDGVIKIFNFFRTITIDPNNRTLKLAVNVDFQYLINDLVGNYTEYDLKHMVGLSSKYSKQLFKLLKQFDNNLDNPNKFYLKKTNEFKENLGIPKGYDRTSFSKLLREMTKELYPFFQDLKLHKLNSDSEPIKRGQKAEYLKWTWKNLTGLNDFLDETKRKAEKDGLLKVKEKKKLKGAIEIKKVEESKVDILESDDIDQLKVKLLNGIIKDLGGITKAKSHITVITSIDNIEALEEYKLFLIQQGVLKNF